ncbi:hypothetical protein EJB05_02209 [Eragrostis curvula]|uniref:Uncharacterized protein n=1 Tax=Eragrostis curvula TaxID=38414 RepID=A0A5J9WRN9_9POAL|nr:hypothetical protein EJB05_02209 [Eragrostis curvula]
MRHVVGGGPPHESSLLGYLRATALAVITRPSALPGSRKRNQAKLKIIRRSKARLDPPRPLGRSMSSSKMKKKTSSAVFPLPMDDSMVDVAAAKKINLPLFVSVKVACILALFGACLLAAFADYSLINSPCNPADSSCIDLTDAAGAKVEALERAQLWVSGVQAVAALLGLLLSGHCSLVLAYVALTVGAANLCMEAVVDAIFIAAAPETTPSR